MPKQLIIISGKSKNVFSYLELLAKYRGNMTLGELARMKPCGNA
jgi:hypothetical protein